MQQLPQSARYHRVHAIPSPTTAPIPLSSLPGPSTSYAAAAGSTASAFVSVSDLCGADEIEFLLDDIRDLVEPVSCRPEDIQDFEIAGSRTGAVSAELSLLESPLGGYSVHSWDSHAHYRQRAPLRDASPLFAVPILCDAHQLKSPSAVVKVLLVITSVACFACLCSSGTVQVGLFLLPLVGRIRIMMFVAIFSVLVTCLLLFVDISHIAVLFPFNWGKINTWLYLAVGLTYVVAASLLFHTVFFAEAFSWVPRYSKHRLLATGILGYVCALESFSLTLLYHCTSQYRTVPEDASEMCLQDTAPSPTSPPPRPICYQHHSFQPQPSAFPSSNQNHTTTPSVTRNNKVTHSYSYQGYEYQPVASTSRHCPRWLPVNQEDQDHLTKPCSSKSGDECGFA